MSSPSSPSSTQTFSPEYIHHDEGGNLVGVSIAMMPFTAAIVGLRLWCRKKKKTPIGWDDWMSVISLPFLWALAVLGILSVYTGGVGRHLPVILEEDPDMLGRSLFCLFLGEIAYGTALFTVKQSILLLYQRIFPTRSMRVAGFLLGGLSAAWWLVVCFVSIFQCTPIKKMWHPFMEEGKCLDSNKFFLGNLIPNIIIDVLILALPVYEVVRLQIRRAQKIAIASIFLLGGLVVIISCIRLTAIVDFITIGPDGDVTLLVGPCWIWTTVEPSIGLLCASLPIMQPLLNLLFGRFIHKPSNDRADNSGVITIGGTGSKVSNKSRGPVNDRVFKRLHDNDSAEDPVLWPETHSGDGGTTCEGTPGRSAQSEDIPLDAIVVERSLTWKSSQR